jgi:hypothetical protein
MTQKDEKDEGFQVFGEDSKRLFEVSPETLRSVCHLVSKKSPQILRKLGEI